MLMWLQLTALRVALIIPLGGAVGIDDTSAASTAPALFTVGDDSFSDAAGTTTVRLKILQNTVTGERAAVSVNFGGGVEELELQAPAAAHPRSVLWTHARNASAVKLNADWRGRMLIPCESRPSNAHRFSSYAFLSAFFLRRW